MVSTNGRRLVSPDCARKIGYATEDLAAVECRRLQGNDMDHHYQTYQCPECGDWHVGHAPGQAGRSRPVLPDIPPEQPGEYTALIQEQLRLQTTLGELKYSRPVGFAKKRRLLLAELASTNRRIQEIKAMRPAPRQWTLEEKAAYQALLDRVKNDHATISGDDYSPESRDTNAALGPET